MPTTQNIESLEGALNTFSMCNRHNFGSIRMFGQFLGIHINQHRCFEIDHFERNGHSTAAFFHLVGILEMRVLFRVTSQVHDGHRMNSNRKL